MVRETVGLELALLAQGGLEEADAISSELANEDLGLDKRNSSNSKARLYKGEDLEFPCLQ